MLKIDIRSLSNGVHDLSFTPSPEEIEVSQDKFTDLKLDVRLDIASRRLYVRVKIAAIVLEINVSLKKNLKRQL